MARPHPEQCQRNPDVTRGQEQDAWLKESSDKKDSLQDAFLEADPPDTAQGSLCLGRWLEEPKPTPLAHVGSFLVSEAHGGALSLKPEAFHPSTFGTEGPWDLRLQRGGRWETGMWRCGT